MGGQLSSTYTASPTAASAAAAESLRYEASQGCDASVLLGSCEKKEELLISPGR